jgi:hypothetical protein
MRIMAPSTRGVLGAIAALALAACTTVPTGPSVMVLPGSGKSFEAFQGDDAICRSWASQQIGVNPGQAAGERTVAGAAIGTGLGAASGALIGAAAGNPAAGAAIGGGAGLLMGTAGGASQGGAVGNSLQGRFDNAYQQCMYAKGNQIPAALGSVPAYAAHPPPPKRRPRIPPPPPGPPPPPPPGVQ